MKSHFCVPLLLLAEILLYAEIAAAFLHRSDHGVTIYYDIKYKNLCLSNAGRFYMKSSLSVTQCVEECGLRKHCAALTYRRHYGLCELFSFTEDVDVRRGDCISIDVSDIAVTQTPCDDCMYGQTCDPFMRDCVYKECLNATILTRAETVGNRNEIGAMLKYACTHGYREINNVTTVVCLETGQWDTSVNCEMDCDNPPSINNGHLFTVDSNSAIVSCEVGYQSAIDVISCVDNDSWDIVTCDRIDCGDPPVIVHGTTVTDAVNGTYYLSTANVSCDVGYQTETNYITCTITGNWETASCIDCYAGSRQEYMGKINITLTGRVCQRWDSQSPHPHEYTDLQKFLDPTLAAASNYCRTPSGDYDPWCMTMDPGKEWEYCDVQQCPWI